MRDLVQLWEIPAFRNNTFFADFAKPGVDAKGDNQRTFNYRFLKQIDFDQFWKVEKSRGYLSKDPENKFLASPLAGSARTDHAQTPEQKADAEAYRTLHAVKSTVIEQTPEIPVVKDPASLPPFVDDRAQLFLSIKSELLALPDGVETRPESQEQAIAQTDAWVKAKITDTVTTLLTAVELEKYSRAYREFFDALDTLDEKLAEQRFINGDFVTDSDIRIFATLVQFDAGYSRYLGPVLHRIQDYPHVWPYLRDLYQIPAFFHAVDWKAIVPVGKKEGGRAYMPNAWYDRFLPAVDLDALWKAETIDRASLSEDPTHPLYLSANPRFSLDPSWYDLGAEGKPADGCCCG